jgi:PAS domain S-box-containing protein
LRVRAVLNQMADHIHKRDEQLRAGEERLLSILDHSTAVVYLKDKQGRFMFVNRWFEILFHVKREQLTAKTGYDLFPKEQADAFAANDAKVLAAGAPLEFEEVAQQDDGPHTYISIKFPLFDSHGVAYAVCGISTDITERKRGEEAMQRARDFLNSIVEMIPQMIFMKDARELRFVMFNKAGEELIGHKREEMIGRNDYDFFPKDEADFFTAKDREVLQSGQLLDIPEEPIQTAHQGVRILRTKKMRILDHQGAPLYLLGISEDVTERRQAEKAQAHLAAIVEFSSDPIISKTLDGRVTSWNPAAEALFGYSAGEMLGQSIQRIIPVDRMAEEDAILAQLQAGKRVELFETVRVAKDGRRFPVLLTISPIKDRAGQVIGGSKIVRDITERKRLQKEILEISDREKARIGQDLHDGLCQLLVRTAFASEVMEQEFTDKTSAQAARAQKISGLLDDAITQARNLARGLYPVKLGAEGFDPALKELCADCARQSGIACELVCQAPVLVEDDAVAMHLYRIAQEAVNNAVKHAACTRVTVELVAGDTAIVMKITDNGGGIDGRERNQQGMGLHIMKYRAALIAASLEIGNGPSGGTVVCCSLSRRSC